MPRPFLGGLATAFMLFEASTVPLCAFNILQVFGMTHTALYKRCRVLFAVLFVIFRVGNGFPTCFGFYKDMFALANDPAREVHSAVVYSMSLALPIPFMGLQLFWLWLIVKAFLKKGKDRDDSPKGQN
jgi:hypothetical protein